MLDEKVRSDPCFICKQSRTLECLIVGSFRSKFLKPFAIKPTSEFHKCSAKSSQLNLLGRYTTFQKLG